MIPPTQPIGSFDDRTGLWTLGELWRCDIGGGRTLLIAPGFTSDGASIPRILWRVAGPQYAPDTFPAALAHDALYASELVSRKEADDIFYWHLRLRGVPAIKAYAYWLAVRAVGWIVWQRHTDASREEARKYVIIKRWF